MKSSSSKLLAYDKKNSTGANSLSFEINHTNDETTLEFGLELKAAGLKMLKPELKLSNFPEFAAKDAKDGIDKYAEWLIRAGEAIKLENAKDKLTKPELLLN